MREFFSAATPWILIGLSIAFGLAKGVKSRRDGTVKERKTREKGRFRYTELKLTRGMAIGLAIGVVVGLVQIAFRLYDWVFCMGLGLTLGMSIGIWLEGDKPQE